MLVRMPQHAVDITSRAGWPRLDLTALKQLLNDVEESVDVKWTCDRFTDSGPILRLDSVHGKLTKVCLN